MFHQRYTTLSLFLVLTCFLIGCEPQPYLNQNVSNNNIMKDNTANSFKKDNLANKSDKNINRIEKKEVLNIGIMVPLTGEHYRIGRSLLNSAQLALERTDQKNIRLFIADSGNSEEVIKNFYNLLRQDIELVVGPVFTENVEKIKPISKENNIPIITFSNNSFLEEELVYVFGLTLDDEIKTLLEYSKKNNFNDYVVILPKNDHGIIIKNKIDKINANKDMSSFKYVFYDSDNPNFYEIAKNVSNYESRKIELQKKILELEKEDTEEAQKKLVKLKKLDTYGDLDFDALIIITQNFSELSNLSSILPYYDVDPKSVQYIGYSMWAKDLSLKEPSLNNSFFTSLNISSKRKFETKYKDYFKNKPHALAMLSYDLIGLISKINGFDSMFKHEMLFSDAGFVGITSWFKFNRNGKVLRKPFIYHIKNQKFQVIN